jgi:hypothetical protein
MLVDSLTPTPDYSGLIAQAVSQRQAENSNPQGPKTQAANKLLATLRTQSVYTLAITVNVGRARAQVAWDTLNLPSELISTLTQAGATCPSVDVFRGLAKRGTSLKSAKEALQDTYLTYGGGLWFCREQDLPAVAERIAAMQALATELREELATIYDGEFQAYLQRVGAVLAAAGLTPNDAATVLDRLAAAFPTLAQAQDGFGVTIDGPYRIPSFTEQASQDNALAAEFLASSELQALAELQEQYKSRIQSAITDATAQATDSIYALIAEQLERCSGIDAKGLNPRSARKMSETIEILQRKLDFNQDLAGLVADISSATQAAQTGQHDELARAIGELRNKLAGDIDQIKASSSTGHRKIAAFMLG